MPMELIKRKEKKFIADKGLVCVNDGSGGRCNSVQNTENVIDLTLISKQSRHLANHQLAVITTL